MSSSESNQVKTQETTIEVWRVPVGFPDYEVSNLGRVKSHKKYRDKTNSRLLKESKSAGGYRCVTLVNKIVTKGFLIHRLVAETFIRPLKRSEVVHHLDHDKSNNSLTNLRILSRAQNTREAMITGSNKAPHSGKGKSKRFTEEEVSEIRRSYANGEMTYMELANKYKRNISSIYHILKGNSYCGKTNFGLTKVSIVKNIKQMLRKGFCDEDICDRLNVPRITVQNIRNGSTFTSEKYKLND